MKLVHSLIFLFLLTTDFEAGMECDPRRDHIIFSCLPFTMIPLRGCCSANCQKCQMLRSRDFMESSSTEGQNQLILIRWLDFFFAQALKQKTVEVCRIAICIRIFTIVMLSAGLTLNFRLSKTVPKCLYVY